MGACEWGIAAGTESRSRIAPFRIRVSGCLGSALCCPVCLIYTTRPTPRSLTNEAAGGPCGSCFPIGPAVGVAVPTTLRCWETGRSPFACRHVLEPAALYWGGGGLVIEWLSGSLGRADRSRGRRRAAATPRHLAGVAERRDCDHRASCSPVQRRRLRLAGPCKSKFLCLLPHSRSHSSSSRARLTDRVGQPAQLHLRHDPATRPAWSPQAGLGGNTLTRLQQPATAVRRIPREIVSGIRLPNRK
ncbi:hypothetical protein B0J12DRAFT_87707 [Macrophomina phaseolina]|uniref:Uncharacterized protein n=1 Tax=Macrophomina phaseolina TaxID=35725 RepID=A0ABQ8GAI7_9PEZI|nr:hypothetical protein B0J12DRAFT_87707 [Macrophomina phaseolina]